jgi:hypothetical protein
MGSSPATAPDPRRPLPMAWHAMSPESAVSALLTEVTRGLSEA